MPPPEPPDALAAALATAAADPSASPRVAAWLARLAAGERADGVIPRPEQVPPTKAAG